MLEFTEWQERGGWCNDLAQGGGFFTPRADRWLDLAVEISVTRGDLLVAFLSWLKPRHLRSNIGIMLPLQRPLLREPA